MTEKAPPVPAPTHKCPDCGRTFNEDPYKRHVLICKDIFSTKKHSYDPAESRRLQEAIGEIGTKKLSISRNKRRGLDAAGPEQCKKQWQKNSEDLRNAMKQGRDLKKAIERGKITIPILLLF